MSRLFRQFPTSSVSYALFLLTDVTSTVLTPEHRSGLTDETAVVAAVSAASVVAVVIRVDVVSERCRRNGAGRTDRAANHARGYFTRPESAVSVIDAVLGLRLTDGIRPSVRILRQCRRCDAVERTAAAVRSFKFISCLRCSDAGANEQR